MFKHPKVASYFDEALCKKEQDFIFSRGLNYMGHKLMVPKTNDYQVLPYHFDRYILFNQGDRIEAISNICLHRQAKLLEGRGNTKNISCKLHCWTYSNRGELKAAPHFDHKPDASLAKNELQEWNGLLFKGRAPSLDLKEHGLDQYLNFDEYMFARSETTTYQFNWKCFMEIYLENYHVFSMHPGLKKFVTPADLEWVFGDDFSIQKVGLGRELHKETTPKYRKWHDAVMKRFGDKLPRYGAIWCLIYPNIMIEWYPEVIVISTIFAKGPRECVNHVEYFYNKDLYAADPSYFEAEIEAYQETAVEDDEACTMLDRGRETLYLNGEEEYGPVDSFLEAGVQKFYEFLDQKNQI